MTEPAAMNAPMGSDPSGYQQNDGNYNGYHQESDANGPPMYDMSPQPNYDTNQNNQQNWNYDNSPDYKQNQFDNGMANGPGLQSNGHHYQDQYEQPKKQPDKISVENQQFKLDSNDQVVLMLQLMLNESPHVEYLDLSSKNITHLDKIIVEIAKFEDVKDLHLANNNFKFLPSNLNDYLFRIQNLNLNQVDFDDFTGTIESLATLSELRSLYINLVEEDQVDQVMRTIEDLEFLNGLPVEKKFPTPKPESLEDNEEDIIQEASREEDEISGTDDEDDDDLERADDNDPDMPLNIDVNGIQNEAHYETGEYEFQTSTDRSRQNNHLRTNQVKNTVRSASVESESEFHRGGIDDEVAVNMENVKQKIEEKMHDGIEDVYIDATQQGISPNLISENFKNLNKNPMAMLRDTSLRTLDPLKKIGNLPQNLPHTEFAQFENPTLEFIEDYKHVLADHGVNEQDIRRIAASYDNLRQVRRQNPAMIQHNNDRKLAKYFEKNLKALVLQIKRLRNKQIKAIVDVEAKRGLLEILNEIKSEYLTVTDPGLKEIDEFHFSMATKIIDQSLNMYYRQIQNNDLFQALEETRQRADDFEHKYRKELAINKQHVRTINQMQRQILKMQEDQLVTEREKRVEQRTKSKVKKSKEKKKKSDEQVKKVRMQKVKNKKPNLNGPIGQLSQQDRLLSIRQLKELIFDIQMQKVKFDKKSVESRMPRQTMEQYMFTYLNQKYGLRPLIIEWSVILLNSVCQFKDEDHSVRLFAKIIKNDCDEEFLRVQDHVKDTLDLLLRTILREKHPMKQELEISNMCTKIQTGQIQEPLWRSIIEKMYDFDDQNKIQELIQNQIKYRQKNPTEKQGRAQKIDNQAMNAALAMKINGSGQKMTREVENALKIFLKQDHLLYKDFQKCILDFQLYEHEAYLHQYRVIFKGLDAMASGYLNDEQFQQLIYIMNEICQDCPTDLLEQDVKMTNFYLVTSQSEVDYLLQTIDPYGHNQITYSDTVSLLSKHMVQSGIPGDFQSIPLLEKFHNICEDIGPTQVELRINQFLTDSDFLQSQVDFQTFAGPQSKKYEQQRREKKFKVAKPQSLQAYLNQGAGSVKPKDQSKEPESDSVPAPPQNAQAMPAPPPEVALPELTKKNAPVAPTNVVQPPPLNPAVIRRSSIMVPPPPSVPQLRQLLGDAIKNLYKKKIPAPPKMDVVLPPIPEVVAPSTLTTESAPQAPANVVKPPPIDRAVLKRNSIMVPPPPGVPQLKDILFAGIKNLYKSKIPPVPQGVPVPPPVPSDNFIAPELTKQGAPQAPKSVAPPLDRSIMKRNSIMVPPPMFVPGTVPAQPALPVPPTTSVPPAISQPAPPSLTNTPSELPQNSVTGNPPSTFPQNSEMPSTINSEKLTNNQPDNQDSMNPSASETGGPGLAREATFEDGIASSKGTVMKMVASQRSGSMMMSAQMSDAGTVMIGRGHTFDNDNSRVESDVFLKGTPSGAVTISQSHMGDTEEDQQQYRSVATDKQSSTIKKDLLNDSNLKKETTSDAFQLKDEFRRDDGNQQQNEGQYGQNDNANQLNITGDNTAQNDQNVADTYNQYGNNANYNHEYNDHSNQQYAHPDYNAGYNQYDYNQADHQQNYQQNYQDYNAQGYGNYNDQQQYDNQYGGHGVTGEYDANYDQNANAWNGEANGPYESNQGYGQATQPPAHQQDTTTGQTGS